MIDHLLIHRATITDVRRTAGTGGAWPESRVVRASDVKCRRQAASSSEHEIAANHGVFVTHILWLKPDQAIERDDEVLIDGTTYYVRVPNLAPSIPLYKKALLEERVQGA